VFLKNVEGNKAAALQVDENALSELSKSIAEFRVQVTQLRGATTSADIEKFLETAGKTLSTLIDLTGKYEKYMTDPAANSPSRRGSRDRLEPDYEPATLETPLRTPPKAAETKQDEPPLDSLSAQDLENKYKQRELTEMCKTIGVPWSGTKAQQSKRIFDYYHEQK